MLSGRFATLLVYFFACISSFYAQSSSTGYTLIQQANTFHRNNQHDSSAHYFVLAAKIYEQEEKWDSAANMYTNASSRYSFARNVPQAIEMGGKAVSLAQEKTGPDSWETARAHFSQFVLAANFRQAEMLQHHSREALRIYQLRAQHEELELKKLSEIGILYEMVEQYGLATKHLEQALAIYQEMPMDEDPRAYLLTVDRLRQNYNNLGRFRDGLNLSPVLMELAKKVNRRDILQITFQQDGLMYMALGDYEQAILNLNQAPPFKTRNAVLAQVFEALNMPDSAIMYLEKGLELNHPYFTDDFNTLQSMYVHLAQLYHKKGEDQHAQSYLQAAEQWFQDNGHFDKDYAEYLYRRGKMETESNQLEAAEQHFLSAIQILDTLFTGPNAFSPVAHAELARFYEKTGAMDQAFEQYEQAIRLSSIQQNISVPDQLPDFSSLVAINHYQKILISLGQLLLQKGQQGSGNQQSLENAIMIASSAVAFGDSIRLGVRQPESRTAWAEQGFVASGIALEALFELYQQTEEQALLSNAFFFMEKAKSMLLTADLQNRYAMTYSGLPDSLLDKEASLTSQLAYYEQQLIESQSMDSVTKQLIQQERYQLKNELADLIKELERNHPDYYQLKYQLEPLSLQQIQNKLETGSAVLECYQGENDLFLLSITADDLRFRRIPLTNGLLEQLVEFKKLAKSSRSYDAQNIQSYSEAAFAVYQGILAPVWDDRWRSVSMIPDGDLWNLPVEACLNSPASPSPKSWSDLPFLIRSSGIHYAYSASMLYRDRHQQAAPQTLVAFAPSYPGHLTFSSSRSPSGMNWEDFGPLAFTQPEAEAITDLMSGTAILGPEATKERFIKEAGQYNMLHLAMHGFFYEDNPLYSGLVFSPLSKDSSTDDGILHAYELYQMDLAADLAVLSACQTGSGTFQAGDGIMSLARAFRYAGCPNIVMSQWDAEEVATKELMILFYERMAEGKSIHQALHEAKLAYLRNSPAARSAPSFWANFVLLGPGEAPASSSKNTWMILLLVLGIGLSSLWYVSRRKKA